MIGKVFFYKEYGDHLDLHVLTHSFPTRSSSDLLLVQAREFLIVAGRRIPPGLLDAGLRAFGVSDAAKFREHDGLAAMRVAVQRQDAAAGAPARSEEHTSELQSLMRISFAVFCLK